MADAKMNQAERAKLMVLHALATARSSKDINSQGSVGPTTRYQALLEQNAPTTPFLNGERETALKLIDESGLTENLRLQARMLTLTGVSVLGHLLPAQQVAILAVSLMRASQARALFHVVPVYSRRTKAAGISEPPTSSWEDPTTRMSYFSSPTFTDLDLVCRSLFAGGLATREFFEELGAEYTAALIAAVYGASLALGEERSGFLGTGLDEHGGQTGLLAAAGNVVTMSGSRTSIAQVTAEDALALKRGLPKTKRSPEDLFMMSEDVFDTLLASRAIDGTLEIQPARDGGAPMLWGRPVRFVTAMGEIVDAPSVRFMAYGSPRAMLMGIRNDVTFIASPGAVATDNEGEIIMNALLGDGVALTLRETIGFKCSDPTRLVVLQTAAA